MLRNIFLILTLIFASVFQLSHAQEKKPMTQELKKATFAGGCFWCMEPPFEKMPGVLEVVSGYTGGQKPNPSYEEVSTGKSGHIEAVQITYDPSKTSYEDLLEVFWQSIDPTDAGGQFADRGSQYLTGIFYQDAEQKELAEESKRRLQASGKFQKEIASFIRPAQPFYPAEDYHQNYYKKNPERYSSYRKGSGREDFLESTWKKLVDALPKFDKPDAGDLKKKLTPEQFHVTQENGTEAPFQNEYWNNKREGLYVDVTTGEPLFSSRDKFDSGTGWPSFTRPIQADKVAEKVDSSHGMRRVEVRSQGGNAHLGHLFNDGPKPTGMRYCINSASLRFVAKEDLEKEGYGEYLKLFEGEK